MTNRVLMGHYGSGVYGLKVSLPGYDVTTANDQQLIFNSQWGGAAVIHQSGTSSIGSTVSFSSLSYVPIVLTCAIGSGATFFPYNTTNWSPGSGSGSPYTSRSIGGVLCSITSSSVEFLSPPAGFTAPYSSCKYIVLKLNGGT